mmetsp:Transcript_58928/g.126883  ORF Transcript_58928/g.126883 Transcript_58928/m.126883 type:complete len:89 (-) Transcript_58928:419-685(-)
MDGRANPSCILPPLAVRSVHPSQKEIEEGEKKKRKREREKRTGKRKDENKRTGKEEKRGEEGKERRKKKRVKGTPPSAAYRPLALTFP